MNLTPNPLYDDVTGDIKDNKSETMSNLTIEGDLMMKAKFWDSSESSKES